MEKMWIRPNSDGSTNNLPDYLYHSREKLAKDFYKWLAFYEGYGWIVGIMNYAIPMLSLRGIPGQEGKMLDLWNIGVAPFFASCLIY
mmetsp:Transcript_24250/g.37393  ORF Transcript_24250/g.37393 Transcript_24250/m.37393 type:complete len:87 (+) Transcript_24250:2884-3144(+)